MDVHNLTFRIYMKLRKYVFVRFWYIETATTFELWTI